MRIKPVLLILLAVLLAIWIMYPTLKANMLNSNNDITVSYEFVDGQMIEVID